MTLAKGFTNTLGGIAFGDAQARLDSQKLQMQLQLAQFDREHQRQLEDQAKFQAANQILGTLVGGGMHALDSYQQQQNSDRDFGLKRDEFDFNKNQKLLDNAEKLAGGSVQGIEDGLGTGAGSLQSLLGAAAPGVAVAPAAALGAPTLSDPIAVGKKLKALLKSGADANAADAATAAPALEDPLPVGPRLGALLQSGAQNNTADVGRKAAQSVFGQPAFQSVLGKANIGRAAANAVFGQKAFQDVLGKNADSLDFTNPVVMNKAEAKLAATPPVAEDKGQYDFTDPRVVARAEGDPSSVVSVPAQSADDISLTMDLGDATAVSEHPAVVQAVGNSGAKVAAVQQTLDSNGIDKHDQVPMLTSLIKAEGAKLAAATGIRPEQAELMVAKEWKRYSGDKQERDAKVAELAAAARHSNAGADMTDAQRNTLLPKQVLSEQADANLKNANAKFINEQKAALEREKIAAGKDKDLKELMDAAKLHAGLATAATQSIGQLQIQRLSTGDENTKRIIDQQIQALEAGKADSLLKAEQYSAAINNYMGTHNAAATGVGGSPVAPPAVGKIKVFEKSTGRTGTIDASQFDPAKYGRL